MIIFPNPTDNDIVLKFVPKVKGQLRYALYDLQGRIVIQGESAVRIIGIEYFLPIDLPELSSGLYILKSKLQHKTFTNKLRIE